MVIYSVFMQYLCRFSDLNYTNARTVARNLEITSPSTTKMSDNCTLLDRNKVKWELTVSTEFPLQYVQQQAAKQSDLLFCLEIPWPLLCTYSDTLANIGTQASYVDLLNSTLGECWFNIRKDCTRIENLLYKNATVIKKTCRKATGRMEELNNNIYKLSVRRNEIETVDTLKAEIEKCRDEAEEWKKNVMI